jgi:hypothetical protein
MKISALTAIVYVDRHTRQNDKTRTADVRVFDGASEKLHLSFNHDHSCSRFLFGDVPEIDEVAPLSVIASFCLNYALLELPDYLLAGFIEKEDFWWPVDTMDGGKPDKEYRAAESPAIAYAFLLVRKD